MTGVDVPCRIAFASLFTGLTLLRVWFRIKSGSLRDRMFTDPREIGLSVLWVCLGIPLLVTVVIFIFMPGTLPWTSMPVPAALRWTGALLCAAAVLLLLAVHRALGRNFSPTLRLRKDHTLVTTGPYRLIRHPMYLAYLVLFAGASLLAADWVIGATGMGIIASHVLFRVPREERILLERFGEEFLGYRERTGRLVPRARRMASRRSDSSRSNV